MRAGLALLAVDRPMMLEVAEFTRALHVVAQARSAGRNGTLEYVADGVGEALGARRISEEMVSHSGRTRWVVMADPEGNEFCVLAARAD